MGIFKKKDITVLSRIYKVDNLFFVARDDYVHKPVFTSYETALEYIKILQKCKRGKKYVLADIGKLVYEEESYD